MNFHVHAVDQSKMNRIGAGHSSVVALSSIIIGSMGHFQLLSVNSPITYTVVL